MSGTGANGRGVAWAAAWLVLVVVVSTPAFGAEPEVGEAQEAESAALHVAVIGASVSGGFGSGVPLADVLEAAIEGSVTVTDLADVTFFVDPLGRAKKVIEALTEDSSAIGVVDTTEGPQEVIVTFKKDPPDLVIGIDFLFWFAYGDKSAAARTAALRKGLEFLETLECPVVVGDLPAFAASFMLGAEQIPSDEELEALNATIAEWAKKHKNVTVYPLAVLVESIRKGQAVTINGEERTLKADEVFQLDRLHVTKTGIVAVTAMVLEALAQDGGPLAGRKLILDPDRLAEKLEPAEVTAPTED